MIPWFAWQRMTDPATPVIQPECPDRWQLAITPKKRRG
jgi:hypothetical protein